MGLAGFKWPTGKTYSDKQRDELRKTAGLLSKEMAVNVHIETYGDESYYDASKKQIVIGTIDMYKRSAEYYIGILLHEMGHVNYTDMDEVAKSPHRATMNMLEDERVNALVSGQYAGAESYLSAMHEPHDMEMLKWLEKAPNYGRSETMDNYDQKQKAVSQEFPEGASSKEWKKASELARKEMRGRVIARAYLDADGVSTRVSTGVTECDALALKVAGYMRRARVASKAELTKIVNECEKLLSSIYVIPEQPKQTSQTSGRGKGPPDGREGVMMELLEDGGHGDTKSSYDARGDNVFTTQDVIAQPKARSLAAKLIKVLRENERTKYEGGKKKGTLDKKQLTRVARDNYRVYKKRTLPKGKKYAIQVVLDCSGSMWGQQIHPAMYASLLAIRAFRALGYTAGLTFYGWEAVNVLDGKDTYVRSRIQEFINPLSGEYYYSGANETHKGIKLALPRLFANGVGCEKILLVITDGGLNSDDIEESHKLLTEAQKKGVHPVVLYIGSSQRILKDEAREITINNSQEVPQAVMGIIKKAAHSVLV